MKISRIKDVTQVRIEQNGGSALGELEAGREIPILELEEALAGTGYKVRLV